MTSDTLDLDALREQRAAAREGRGRGLPIVIGGETITVLPSEFPLDVLTPLKAIDEDLALMLRSALHAVQGGDQQAKWDATNLVIDILASNPRLPLSIIEVIVQIGHNLFDHGDYSDGFDRLIAARPSREDIAALTKGIFGFYGVSLGEALGSSASPNGGGPTSKPISSTTTTSTPEESTPTPVTPDS
jgi:hypothetical protein